MRSSIGKTCPFCQYPIKPGEPIVICEGCGIPHHRACWEHNGQCTTYGCEGTHRQRSYQNTSQRPMNSGVVDLSDIMSEPEYEPVQQYQPQSYQPQPYQQPQRQSDSQAPLSAAAGTLGGAGGLIGAIIGAICGLAAGGIGCIPGAIVGFFVGAMAGGLLIYAFILVVSGGIGYALGAAGGPDAAGLGAIVGLIIGIGIIVLGSVKRS